MNKKGFTLIELLVVIAIIGLLATIVMVSLNSARGKARDSRRLGDMKSIQLALAMYYDKYGNYPNSDNGGCGGWDCSGDGNGFVHALVTEGFLAADPSDPNNNSSCGNYCYYRYTAGDYACDSARGYYFVLGVRDMETSGNPYPGNPGWNCTSRNWQDEFDWVTGQFEK